jgi:hypothetical protein
MAESDFDMNAVVTEAMRHADVTSRINEQIKSLMPTSEDVDSTVQYILGGTDKNGDTALSLQTKELGELEAQQRKQAFYNQLGNGQGYAKIATDLSTQFYNTMESAKETAKSVAERKSVGLLDNPLAWAINRIILPDEEAELSGKLDQAKIASEQLQTLTKMSDDEARIENTFASKLTAASVDSKVQGLANDLNAKAAQTRLQANAQNVHTLNAIMQADGQQLQNMKYVMDVRISEAHLALSQKEFAIRSQQFAAWQEDRAENKDFAEQMTQLYNIGADAMGRPQLTSNKVQLAIKMGGQVAQEAQTLVELGAQNLNNGAFKLGATPAGVLDTVQKTRSKLPEDVESVYKYAMSVVKNTPGLDHKNPAAVNAAVNEAVKAKSAEYLSNVDYRDQTSPYILPPPKTLGTQAEINKTALYQKVLAPLVATESLTTSDPDKIVQLGLKAVENGTITPKEFMTGVTTYYDTGRAVNNIGRDLIRYGIPEQKDVRASLKSFESVGASPLNTLNPFSTYTTKVVSVSNPVEFNNWAVKQLSAMTGKKVEGY